MKAPKALGAPSGCYAIGLDWALRPTAILSVLDWLIKSRHSPTSLSCYKRVTIVWFKLVFQCKMRNGVQFEIGWFSMCQMCLHICSNTFVNALICFCTPFLSVYTYTLVHGLTEEFIYQWFTVPRSKWELQQTLIKLTSNMKKFKITLFKSLYCQEPSSGEIKEITHKEAHYCTPLCITSAQKHKTLFSHSQQKSYLAPALAEWQTKYLIEVKNVTNWK